MSRFNSSNPGRPSFRVRGGAYTDITELIRLRHGAREIEALTPKKSTNPLSGLLTSNFRGRGIDFAEVRTYEPGDDVRTIDWRVTARTQTPHTKLFQEEKERPVLIMVDQSPSMFFGSEVAFKSVAAAEAAALLAWVALENGDRVGGIVFSDLAHREVRPRHNKHAVLRLLNEVNDFNHNLNRQQRDPGTGYLTNALVNIRRVAKHGSTILIISDFEAFDEDSLVHLRQLSRHNDVVGLLIYDRMEAQLPSPDLYTITNGERRLEINTADKKHRQAHQNRFDARRVELRNHFSKCKAPLFELATGDEIVSSLASSFQPPPRRQR